MVVPVPTTDGEAGPSHRIQSERIEQAEGRPWGSGQLDPEKAESGSAEDTEGNLRLRSSRTSPTEEENDHSKEGHTPSERDSHENSRRGGLVQRTPFFRYPKPGRGQEWHAENHTPSEWISLFYDLVVVACLTIFGTTHELSTPGAIPTYLGYFTVIYWVWISQVYYDIRYQGHDGLHQWWKFIQVCVFLYIGAASGGWAPGNIQTAASSGLSGADAIDTEEAEESFKTIVIAYVLSRAQLALQYFICAIIGRRARRSVACHWVSFAVLIASCGLNIAAATIVSRSRGLVVLRLALLYGSIAMEMIVTTIQVMRQSHVKVPTERVEERYGCFILIILGDGLLDVGRALDKSITGLSNDVHVYAQAFMATLIIYLLWSFLCSRLEEESTAGEPSVRLWEILHFCTSFGLILLLAAISNVVLVIANGTGIFNVLEDWTTASDRVKMGGTLSASQTKHLGRHLYKLQLQPEWTTQLDQLGNLWAQSSPNQSPDLINLQYFGQIAIQAFDLYDMDIPDKSYDIYQYLTATDTATSAVTPEILSDAAYNVTQIVNEQFTEALTGTLWLYPTAGIVLILCALRTILWTTAYSSLGYRISIYFQIAAGIATALLGLLDIGRKTADLSLYSDNGHGAAPLYILVLNEVPLVIISVVYAIVFIGPVFVREIIHRRKGGIYVEEVDSWISRVKTRLGQSQSQIEEP